MCASRPERACSAGGNWSSRRSTGAGADRGDEPPARFGELDLGLGPSRRRGSGSRCGAPGRARRRRRGDAARAARRASRDAAGPARKSRNRSCRRSVGSGPSRTETKRPRRSISSSQCAAAGVGGDGGAAPRAQLAQHRAAQQEGTQLGAASRRGPRPAGSRRHGGRCCCRRRRPGAGRSPRPSGSRPGCSPPGAGPPPSRGCARAGAGWSPPASTCAGSCGSSARTSSRSKRRSRSRNSARSSWARSRASASGGSVRVDRTTPHCGGSRSSSRSRNSNTAGSRMRCASSTTIRPRSTSQAASVLSSSLLTARRSLRLPPAMRDQRLGIGAPRRVERLERGAAGRRAGRAGRRRNRPRPRRPRPVRRAGEISPVRAAVLPNPAGAASSTRRLVRAASTMRCSSDSRRTRPARGRGAWILVRANDGEAMAERDGGGYFCPPARPRPTLTAAPIACWRRLLESIDGHLPSRRSRSPDSRQRLGRRQRDRRSATSSWRRRRASGSARSCAATARC